MTAHPGEPRVFLVGAGPGDPGLLTARALELIAGADVVLHDRLIPAGALDGAREDARLIYVGKEGGGPAVAQEEISALLLEHARSGALVVRLKGGDPFVFGRGGEEALLLADAGIAFEVVPGITAGIAAPAYAGIPVTHRDRASAMALITGHEDPGKPESALDWPALAAFPGTLVFYMGVRRLEALTQALIDAGRPPGEPAAVVERGTLPGQRTITAPLSKIAAAAIAAGVKAPAVTVVGRAAELHDRLSWFERRPLAGTRVAVTRARAQSSGLAARLRALGAEVVETPAIRIRALEAEVPDLSGYDLLCLTSPNAARCLFEGLVASGRDARALAGTTLAVVGVATARALREWGVVADVVAPEFVAESLVDALAEIPVERALVARAAEARDVVPDALRKRGAAADVLALYETVAAPLDDAARRSALEADYVTFTSSSTVRFFLDAIGGAGALAPAARTVSIGPVTSATMRDLGLDPSVEADPHDIDGVVAALLADAGR